MNPDKDGNVTFIGSITAIGEITDQNALRSSIPSGTLAVNEIFYSIQGEGKHSGVPMVFVRLNFCSVQCGFCDTKYTWQTIKHNIFLTPQGILEEIKKLNEKCKHVCFTGGEPFEQPEGLFEVCKALKVAGYRVHIETSGNAIIPRKFEDVVYWITCSPKRFNGINFTAPINEIKLLVGQNARVDKLRTWISNFKNRVWVSLQPIEPEPFSINIYRDGEPTEEQRLAKEAYEQAEQEKWDANKKRAITMCKETGWMLSLQLHKYLSIR